MKVINPVNVGWIETTLGSEIMDHLWKCIDNKIGDNR